jgi:hypothetical protein
MVQTVSCFLCQTCQLFECNNTQALACMHGTGGEEIVEPPKSCGHFRLCENPTATKSTQTKCFRQTAGNDKLFTQMKARRWWTLEEHFEINFVHQYTRVHLASDLSNFLQRLFVSNHTAGIMKVGDND